MMLRYRSEIIPDEVVHSENTTNDGTVRDFIQTILFSIVLFLIINFLTSRIRVESVSMRETLKPGDYVVVNKIVYKFDDIQRGDIIVFQPPFQSPEPYIKRVIGLPGDSIVVDANGISINYQRIAEPYVLREAGKTGEWIVPPGKIFVMGDNRGNSSDSRAWGMLPIENVMGKAEFVYWPPSQWGSLTQRVFAANH